jgi:hypothetical protein
MNMPSRKRHLRLIPGPGSGSGAEERAGVDQEGSSIDLPEGLSSFDWELEQTLVQNPRLRAYLGCIELLEQVLDSNYAILHCSPNRLLKIWRMVRKLCYAMRNELEPTLRKPSKIPALEIARQSSLEVYADLEQGVIAKIERYPHHIPSIHLAAVRRLICESLGRLYAFLRDTYGDFLAADPRSSQSADYFISARFPQDIDEAEWLYATVDRLNDYLQSVTAVWSQTAIDLISTMKRERVIPAPSVWQESIMYLNMMTQGLSSRLMEVLALRGIRFREMEVIDRNAGEVPRATRAISEVYDTSRAVVDQLKASRGDTLDARQARVESLQACHSTASIKLIDLLERIEEVIESLSTYVPQWLEEIEKRRGLGLHKTTDQDK